MRRLKSLKRKCLSLALALCMVLGVMGSSMVAEAASTSYYPTEIDDVLTNPYMGWVPWATKTSWQQPHTMVYAAVLWSELEPDARGQFDWEAFETKNNFDYWESKGVKINIRFYMDQPTSSSHMDIPKWLYNKMGSDKGDYYDCSIGKGFSPNYSDSVLISEHERVIKALGERYNSDPNIAFIQIGSLGHWGEYHCWPYSSSEGGPSGEFPPENIANQYVNHYVKYFSSDKLTMRRATHVGKANQMGLFNDMFGDTASLEASGWGWWSQITNGYSDDVGYQQPAMPDFWKYGPSGGEFGNGNAAMYLTDSTVDETVRLAQVSHTSWLGPCSPADIEKDGPNQKNVDKLLKTMGYRFVLEKVTHETSTTAGKNVAVTMRWNNKGVAPFYFQWPVRIGLANDNGVVTYTTVSADIREWLPGQTTVSTDLIVPSTISEGTYKLVVAMIDPATNKPGINLAIKGKRSDGWYELDTIKVTGSSGSGSSDSGSSSTPSTPGTGSASIVVDGSASDWSGISSIASASGQTATSLKVCADDDYLYVCAQGSGLGTNGQVYIDADNKATTGYTKFSAGMDYMLEGSRLYAHPENSNAWSWTEVGSSGVTVSKNSSVYEVKISKSLLSGMGSTITVGFQDINSSWSSVSSLSGSGKVTTTAPSVKVSVDGSASDWANVSTVATASGQTATSLKVYDDSNYVYICVQGSGLGTNGQVYIDRDANSSTGFVTGGKGMDYMLEGSRIYAHPDNSSSWSWTEVGSSGVTVVKNSSVYEVQISKSLISGSGSTINVMFKDIDSSWSTVCSLSGGNYTFR